MIMAQTRQWCFWHLLFWEVFISLKMKNPVGNNKQRFLVDKQSLLLVERSLTLTCRGVHQTQALQVRDLSCPGAFIRLLLGLLLPKTQLLEVARVVISHSWDGTRGRETKCSISSTSFTGKAGGRTAVGLLSYSAARLWETWPMFNVWLHLLCWC